jgi:hypothetical protein
MSENDGRQGLTGTLIEGSIALKQRNFGRSANPASNDEPDTSGIISSLPEFCLLWHRVSKSPSALHV